MTLHLPKSEFLDGEVLEEIAEQQTPGTKENELPFEPLSRDEISLERFDSLLKREKDARGLTTVYLGQFKSQEARELVERAVIQLSLENDPLTLKVWLMLDHDDDIEYVRTLEEKYGIKLENLEAAAHLFSLTYDMWSLTNADYTTEKGRQQAEEKLPGIIESARALSNYTLEATHQVQNPKYINSIFYEQTLKGSTAEHYEGAGVYAGILGGYRTWGQEENTFHFLVDLGNAFPIIASRAEPEAMVVILSDEVDIHKGMDAPAEPMGEMVWQHDDYYRETIDKWKLQLFGKHVNVNTAQVIKQDDGTEALLIRTDEKPIVWASAAKALKVHKVITYR